MAKMALKSLVCLGLVIGLVAGCEPGTTGDGVTSEPSATGVADGGVAPATSVRLVDRDVEAPQDFQVTDKALWDGRPSLGGVWVAATSVRDPMRVIMRNPANGKFVIGALFRREAENPGPKLQISSDAADALGLMAGEPATLNVTALRREEAPVPTPNSGKPLLDTSETLAGADIPPESDGAITAAILAPALSTPGDPAPGKPATTQQAQIATQPAVQPTVAALQSGGPAIQIGIFSVESNASRAVATLASAGVAATIRKETSLGKPLWSVIASGDATVLAKIKKAGFKDAYVIKR